MLLEAGQPVLLQAGQEGPPSRPPAVVDDEVPCNIKNLLHHLRCSLPFPRLLGRRPSRLRHLRLAPRLGSTGGGLNFRRSSGRLGDDACGGGEICGVGPHRTLGLGDQLRLGARLRLGDWLTSRRCRGMDAWVLGDVRVLGGGKKGEREEGRRGDRREGREGGGRKKERERGTGKERTETSTERRRGDKEKTKEREKEERRKG